MDPWIQEPPDGTSQSSKSKRLIINSVECICLVNSNHADRGDATTVNTL